MYMCGAALKNIFSENFLQIIINASLTEFIFSKIPYIQHILMNTFRRMRLNYGNFSLRRILFYTLKQHSDYKSLIA